MSDEAVVFGISLGSGSASIALSKGPKTELLANHSGERTTPTLVSYRDDGGEVVGQAAKQSLHRSSRNTVSHMIPLVGKNFDDEFVGEISAMLTCEVGKDREGWVCYVVGEGEREKQVSVPDSLTLILRSLHETAESFSGCPEMAVVMAVPPDFTAAQKDLVRSCCEEAGFEVMRIISEPSAVCLAHRLGERNRTGKSHVMVYNLGAHTLTISLLLVTGGMYCELATRTVRGNVGGAEFDKVIADFLAAEFEKQWRVGIRGNERCRFKLLAAAESAKHALSTVHTTSVHLESLHDGYDFTYSLSRGRFEGLCTAVFRRCVNSDLISEVLSKGRVTRTEVDDVIMAGGSCKIPQLQSLLETEFPGSEILVSSPEETVATGCALQASLMRERWERGGGREGGEEGVEVPCVPHDLWVKSVGLTDQLLVASLTPLPCQATLSLSLVISHTPSIATLTVSSSQPPEGSGSSHSLELRERSTKHEREIAKLSVPVDGEGGNGDIGEGVSVKITLVWTVDNVITMTTTKKDSNWSFTLPLSCVED